MSGTVNGTVLFECRPDCGLLLRQTQIKPLDGSSGQQVVINSMFHIFQVPSLNIGGGAPMSDSPLLTPKDPPGLGASGNSQALRQMTGVMQGMMKQTSQADDGQQDGGQQPQESKTSSWKDRLEKLRKQKELKKLQDEEIKAHATYDEDAKREQEELKKVFQPSQAIQRDREGKITVQQQETQPTATAPASTAAKTTASTTAARRNVASSAANTSTMSGRQSARPQSKDPQGRSRSKDPYNQRRDNKSRSKDPNGRDASASKEEKKSTLAQRVGTGLKGPTGLQSRLAGPRASAATGVGAKTQTSAAEAAREKIMKKNEEVRQKLGSRQSDVLNTTTSSTTASRLGATQKTAGTAAAASGAEKKDTRVSMATGIKKMAQREGLAIIDGSVAASTTTASKTGTAARPMTSRQSKQEEFKADPAKAGARPSNVKPATSRERSAMKNRLGEKTKSQVEDNYATKSSAVDEDEERKAAPTQTTGRTSVMPGQRTALSKAAGPTKQSSTNLGSESQADQTSAGGMFSGIPLAEFKKQEADLRKSKEEAFALQIEVKELSEKLAELQREHAEKLEELKTEYEIKILELEAKLGDNQLLQNMEIEHNAQKQRLQEEYLQKEQALRQEIEAAKQERDAAIQRANDQAKLVKHAEEEKARVQEELESRILDIETIQLEIDALKDEKEELLNQLRASSEIQNDSASLSGLTEDELKSQNTKLRQAISALTMGFEVEKSKLQAKIAELEKRSRLVEDYEKKLEDMDLLLEEIEIKDQEIKAMEEKLDEQSDFEKMVEEMAEEILKKEEDIEILQARVAELEELNAIQEELSENQDQFVKELNEEIANRDAKIYNMEQNTIQLEEMVLEQDQKATKYKERCNELQQKATMLQDELSSAYSAGDQKVKISTLIEKQNMLITKLREAGKKDMEIMVQKIEFWQEKLKMKVIEGFIPKRLVEETRLDSLEKIQMLNKTKNKALLLTREICEKQVGNIEQIFEDQLQQAAYSRLLIQICEQCAKFIDCSHRIMYVVQKLPIDKYQELTKLMAWNKLDLINQFIEKIMELLKEESLSYKFDMSPFNAQVKSLQDLLATAESKYIEKTAQEIEEEKEEGYSQTNTLSIAQQERQKDLKYIPKLQLRNECLKMSIGVMALSIFSSATRQEETTSKCKLIYWRLLEIVFKLDGIDPFNNGSDYVNLQELYTDTRLEQKFQAMRLLWDREPQSAELEPQERDWSSVLEAIERDITQLNNDYKFKKLLSQVEEEYKESQLQIDDIYQKGWDARGPWTLIVEKIRQDLEDTGAMKEKIEQLQAKVKDQSMQYLIVKREKEDLQIVNLSLEQRLGDAQSKAEKVPALEMEKKRLIEKEQYYGQQIELAKKEIDMLRDKEKELQAKLTDMENNPQFMSRDSMRASTKKMGGLPSTTNAQSRQSRTSQYFQKLAQSSLLGKRDSTAPMSRQTTSVSSNELQKQLQVSEEAFNNIIIELQRDRMMLRGQHLLERLHKLEKEECPMNEYIKQQRERREVAGKLTRDEQGKLESALDNVMYLKKKIKKEMALVRVIDITKREEQQRDAEKKLLKDIVPEGKEKINYEILKAKDQVNEAFKVLFAKDSKLHQTQGISMAQHLKIERIGHQNVDQVLNQSNSIKLGTLRLNALAGTAQVKSVINLVPSQAKELKSHLTLLQ